MIETIVNDLRYGAKMLWKSKGVTIVAVVSLAIGIGANSAIFSLVNSLLLRPRAVARPEQIVELYVGEANHPYETSSYPSYLELRDHNDVLNGLAAYGIRQFRLSDNDVEQIWGEAVSGNYFDVLGVAAQKGRTFSADEDVVPRRNPVAVISNSLWQRRFNSDPELVGKSITLNNEAFTVIGIAPPQYTGMIRGLASEIWIPTAMMPAMDNQSDRILTSRGNRWLMLVGRLKPETTLAQARARFDLLTRDMQAAHPEEWLSKSDSSERARVLSITVLPESETRIHPGTQSAVYGAVALVFVIVNLVLLIACMNLASMLLARAVTRRREMAVRLAIGASRFRIVRQLLTESVLLSVIAGAAGILLAVWFLNLVIAAMPALPEGIRIALDLQLDWRVVIYTVAFSMVTGILFGLAPALHSARADVSTVLKDESSLFGFYRKSRFRMALVVVQVALSLLLLVGAGLVLRSLEKIRPTRLGFTTESMVVGIVRLDETKYDRPRTQEFYGQLQERIASLPGVQWVSLVNELPLTFMGGSRSSIEIEGYQPGADEDMQIAAILAGPHYFTNMRVPFVQGRDFEERDREGAPCVAVVNEAFGEKYFGGGNSLGKRLLKYGGAPNAPRVPCEIVGVIRDDAWQSLEKQAHPFYSLALQQSERRQFTLLVSSTGGDPASLIGAVRNSIRELDPQIPLADVQTLGDYFSVGLYPFRILAVVMGGCGAMALLLAALGIYGVVSYSVAQRTRELGIRMALGALEKNILRMVIRQGMILVVAGLGLGLALSIALTRVLTSSLLELELPFPVGATDPLTFASVTVLLASIALIACYIPARRATKVDPIEALRYE